jgi:RimJ/RimL family protein N-acetyltransferase
MFYQLPPTVYDRVAPLFESLNDQGILTAVLARHRQGKILVDDLQTPQSAFVWSPAVWCFLAGKPDNKAFNESIRDALFNQGVTENEVFIWLCICASEAWQTALGVIAHPRQPVPSSRLYYRCEALQINGRDYLPEGFTAQPINADLRGRTDITLPEDVVNWMAEIGSPAEFYAHSFGFVALHGRDVVAWCFADGIAGDRTELGVHTQEDFRRRGLATALTALAVEHAFSLGLKEVSWQCDAKNVASICVAERVGFQLMRAYTMLAFLSDAEKHAGWLNRLAAVEKTAV